MTAREKLLSLTNLSGCKMAWEHFCSALKGASGGRGGLLTVEILDVDYPQVEIITVKNPSVVLSIYDAVNVVVNEITQPKIIINEIEDLNINIEKC